MDILRAMTINTFLLRILLLLCLLSPVSAIAIPDPRVHLTPDELGFLAEHPVIRVHNEKDWPPFNYNEASRPKGFSIDYMNLLAERLGIEVKYVTGPSWGEFLQMIQKKELDVMLNIINTKERQNYLLFTESYQRAFSAIFTRDDDQQIQSLSDLTGEAVAVPKGFFTETLLKQHYPKIRVYTTKSIHGALLAVMEGNARAAIGELEVVNYLIKQYKTPGIKASTSISDKRFASIHSLGVRRDWPLFHTSLQKAMDSVTDEEMLALNNKWFGSTSQKLELTTQELEFLKTKERLNIAIQPNRAPFSYFDGGTAKGVSVEYARLIGNQLNIKLNFIWKRPGGTQKNSRADLIMGQDQSLENRQQSYLTEPYARSLPGIFAQNDRYYSRLDELKGKRLAVTEGSGYLKLLEQHYPDIALHPVANMDKAIEAVVFDHADAFLADFNEATHQLQRISISSIKALTSVKDSRFISDLSLAVPNSRPLLQSIVKKALKKLDKAEVQLMKQRWLQLQESDDDFISLTTWERDYLQKKNRFTFCSIPVWHPLDFVDDETVQPTGIAIDTLHLVEQKIGNAVKFDWRPSESWPQSIRNFSNAECDMIPAMIKTAPREKYAFFTKPYMSYKAVIITREDEPFFHSFDDVKERGIARQKGSGMINLLHNRYEGVSIVETETTLDSFQKVASGEIYATVAILPVASYYITRYGLSNLKIAGFTDINYPVSIAVHKDRPELFSIVEKALAGIGEKQHRDIFTRWVSLKIDQQVDYSLYFKTLGGILFLALIFLYRHFELSRYNKVLEKLSVEDKLTGLYNRGRLDEVLLDQRHLFKRYNTPFCVIILDADHFKDINDKYGHLTGDQVLFDIANLLTNERRITDILGRWGGEEFMLICPNTTLDGAEALGLSILKAIKDNTFPNKISCTLSAGIAEINPDDTIQSMLQRADSALYEAKDGGRNRIVVARD